MGRRFATNFFTGSQSDGEAFKNKNVVADGGCCNRKCCAGCSINTPYKYAVDIPGYLQCVLSQTCSAGCSWSWTFPIVRPVGSGACEVKRLTLVLAAGTFTLTGYDVDSNVVVRWSRVGTGLICAAPRVLTVSTSCGTTPSATITPLKPRFCGGCRSCQEFSGLDVVNDYTPPMFRVEIGGVVPGGVPLGCTECMAINATFYTPPLSGFSPGSDACLYEYDLPICAGVAHESFIRIVVVLHYANNNQTHLSVQLAAPAGTFLIWGTDGLGQTTIVSGADRCAFERMELPLSAPNDFFACDFSAATCHLTPVYD